MIKNYAVIFLLLAAFGNSAQKPSFGVEDSSTTPLGKLGHVRYMIRDSDFKKVNLGSKSQLFQLHPTAMEMLSPIDSLQQLDSLASLSHEATGMCGSIDFYPLNYRLVDEVSHSPPYFAAEASFTELDTVIQDVQLAQLDATIQTLSSLPSRYHRHSTGKDASQTIVALWQAQLSNDTAWTIKEFPHTNTAQRSVIARLEGSSAASTIVLGAHLDSIGSYTNSEAAAPGADDDASGIAILTEILRIIETRKLRFHRSIELQGYAAEEIGLVGSREIASNYRLSERTIDAMLQFDMAYYSQTADQGLIYFLEDYTSLDLTRTGIQWTKRYLGDIYRRGYLPRGSASDHKAWWEQGYPTLFPFENPDADNPFIHSGSDTKDRFDDGMRMQRMVKLGLLFLAYHAGLESLDSAYLGEQSRLSQLSLPKDLYIALHNNPGGNYSLAISAPANTQFLEFCPMETPQDLRCTGSRLRLGISTTIGSRKVFYADRSWAFAEGEKWRIEAYNSTDELIARRHIRWEKP